MGKDSPPGKQKPTVDKDRNPPAGKQRMVPDTGAYNG